MLFLQRTAQHFRAVDAIYIMHHVVFWRGRYFVYNHYVEFSRGVYSLYYALRLIIGDRYYFYYALRSIFEGRYYLYYSLRGIVLGVDTNYIMHYAVFVGGEYYFYNT